MRFLSHLLGRIAGTIILFWDGAAIPRYRFWDGAAIPRCRAVKDFLAAGAGARLRLVRLPAYAPYLNPDEGVWVWLKRWLGNVCCTDLAELKDELSWAIKRLRARSQVIRSFFERAGLEIS